MGYSEEDVDPSHINTIMAYDDGKSGIGGYINETVRSLAVNHTVEILLLKKDKDSFPVKNVKIA